MQFKRLRHCPGSSQLVSTRSSNMAGSRNTDRFPASNVPRETIRRLELFVELLSRWAPSINLTSALDQSKPWARHVDDSLAAASHIKSSHAIDLGSGAGFPGLVLSIVTNVPFTLVEADNRKCSFLREAARITCAPVTVLAERIEAASPAKAPLVTARALAPLPRLLTHVFRHVEPTGMALLWKGATAADEVVAARKSWEFEVNVIPNGPGAILAISNLVPRP